MVRLHALQNQPVAEREAAVIINNNIIIISGIQESIMRVISILLQTDNWRLKAPTHFKAAAMF